MVNHMPEYKKEKLDEIEFIKSMHDLSLDEQDLRDCSPNQLNWCVRKILVLTDIIFPEKLKQPKSKNYTQIVTYFLNGFMIYFFIKLLPITYLQRNHNSILLELRSYTGNCRQDSLVDIRLFAINATQCPITKSKEPLVDQLKINYLKARDRCKILGAPLIDYDFAVASLYFLLITLVTTIYFYYNYTNFFCITRNLNSGKLIRGTKLSQIENYQIVRKMVNSFIRSSCEYLEINWLKFHVRRDILFSLDWKHNEPVLLHDTLILNKYRNAVAYQKSVTRQIKALAFQGQLHPLNKTQSSIKPYARFLSIAVSSMIMIPSSILTLIALYIIPIKLSLSAEKNLENGLLDMIWQIELGLALLLIISLTTSAVFHVLGVYQNLMDYLRKMMVLSRDCERKLKIFLANRKDSSILLDCDDEKQVREVLLITIIHYKQFVQQFNQTKVVFCIQSVVTFFIVMNSALTIYFYSSYYEPSFRLYIVSFFLMVSLAGDPVYLQICHFDCSCKTLYRRISRLLPLAIDIYSNNSDQFLGTQIPQAIVTCDQVESLPDNHIVWFIRKELNFSDQVIESFTMKTHGVPLTYSTLMKIHFWFGIMLISTEYLHTKSAQSELSGNA